VIRLLAITPPARLAPAGAPELGAVIVDAWLEAGAGELGLAVLLREPGAPPEQILADVRLMPLRQALAERGVPALVSVDPRSTSPEQGARLLEEATPRVAGVQLRGDPSIETCDRWRARLGPELTIGRSIHGRPPEELPTPGRGRVDYGCLAPIFAPNTRLPGDDKRPIGLDGLRRWTRVRGDILALGGITAANADACLAAGARGVAGIRLFFGRSEEARQDVRALCRVIAARNPAGAGEDHGTTHARGRG
jgi:thiamine monophosphate synthase